MKNFIKLRSKKFYITLFTLLVILIALSGTAFYQFRQSSIKLEKYTELSAIADLKVNQIYYWREDKIGDAEFIADDPFFISTVDFYLRTRHDADRREINEWIETLKDHKGYSSVCILDIKLRIRVGDSLMTLPDKNFLTTVLEGEEAIVSDLYMLPDSSVVMDLYIPLVYRQGIIGKPVGLTVLRINPEEYLYGMLASWPNNSPTSELVLWRKEGDDSLVYLNKLRHSDQKPFSRKYGINTRDLPVARAIDGVKGIVEGKDYRGVPVLADIRDVPNTDWLVIAKTDLNEVYAPLRELTLLVLILGIILTGTTASIIGSLWRNQKASFYKKLYDSEIDKKALLKNFEFLTKYANDIILLTDGKGKITYSNEKATSLYGYSDVELKGMNINDLDAHSSTADLEKIFLRAAEEGGLIYEALHTRKDGTVFPVESSSRFIDVDGTMFFQCIIRDITEKKNAEEQLFKTLREKEILLKEVHHRVKNNLQTINSLLNLQASSIEDENSRRFFLDAQNRIKSMALIHQELYTFNLASINTVKYINELVSQLFNSFEIIPGRICINQSIEDKLIGIDLAIPLGLIITEILTNIFKHAFPGNRMGNVYIELKSDKTENLLLIKDDGIGLPEDLDYQNTTSLGMQLIFTLADQIDGKVELRNNNGTEYIIQYNEPAMVKL